ncbi:polysaccharide deacetylase family protein [Rhizohabitans arisaemae]|uniref:polysaccharide deacetylase family protein n=1 Tax=Rhizohabitans arisaemae TaxID=2720610 RepID=UPI0024B0D413|nr:polysaccharide deacetylase family protein [Rhizohabitans arisaemae]
MRTVGIANLLVLVAATVVLSAAQVEPDPVATPGAVETPTAPEPAPTPRLPQPTLPPPVDATRESAAAAQANELGLVPVLMYHRILRKRLVSLDRTPGQLRAEFVRLARSGFVPVTATEFATGRMEIPAGSHPVVLTFDDGHPSHFGLGDDDLPKKGTAVEVLYEVAREYPSFRPVATFWVNGYPFGLRDRKDQARAVQWLRRQGFEVGNHTWDHPLLRSLKHRKVAEQIARTQRLVRQLGGGDPSTLALPYGAMPKRPGWARKGTWDGVLYDFAGVFLAGAEPSVSPYAKGFDPGAIQRIQSNGRKGECRRWCSDYWLSWLDRHPDRLYTSDGDPQKISFPGALGGNIGAKMKDRANPY